MAMGGEVLFQRCPCVTIPFAILQTKQTWGVGIRGGGGGDPLTAHGDAQAGGSRPWDSAGWCISAAATATLLGNLTYNYVYTVCADAGTEDSAAYMCGSRRRWRHLRTTLYISLVIIRRKCAGARENDCAADGSGERSRRRKRPGASRTRRTIGAGSIVAGGEVIFLQAAPVHSE
jgi:hypothetical protein